MPPFWCSGYTCGAQNYTCVGGHWQPVAGTCVFSPSPGECSPAAAMPPDNTCAWCAPRACGSNCVPGVCTETGSHGPTECFGPGVVDVQACECSGTRLRTCQDDCLWGGFESACPTDCRRFFVRDWTDSAAVHDDGAEPSTQAAFWDRSDVWTRLSNTTGEPFPADQPPTEAANADPTFTNYAFARVSRHAPMTGAAANVTVTAAFYFADLGVGANWQPMRESPTATNAVSVVFAPAETIKVSPGLPWKPGATASGHNCMGVQISTVEDPAKAPVMGPGAVLGGGTIRADNNKAQRNIYVTPAPVAPSPAPAPKSRMSAHFIVHNPSVRRRTMVLRYEVASADLARVRKPRVEIVDGASWPLRATGRVELRGMEPGEDRWIRLSFDSVAQGPPIRVSFSSDDVLGKEGAANGVTLVLQPTDLRELVAHNLREHRNAVRRTGALAGRVIQGAGPIDVPTYRTHLRRELLAMGTALEALLPAVEPEGLAVRPLLRSLQKQAGNSGFGDRDLAVAHAAWLERLDARLTRLQLSRGNPADIPQNVRWQVDVVQRLKLDEKKRAAFLKPSGAFLHAALEAPLKIEDRYIRYIDEILPGLEALELQGLEMKAELASLRSAERSPAPLQKAHRGVLLKLHEAAEDGPAIRQRKK